MPKTSCAPGAYTDIPAVAGNMLVEARGRGGYVDTTGAKPADYSEGYALASNSAYVVAEGLAVAVWNPHAKAINIITNPV